MVTVQERTGRLHSPTKSTAPDESREDDETIEVDLLTLLGQLEYYREAMMLSRLEGRVARVVELSEKILQDVIANADEHPSFATVVELKTAAAKARDFQNVLTQAKNRDRMQGEDTLVKRCLLALQEAVIAYFTTFTRRFSTSTAARSWVEVAAIFVVDIRLKPPSLCNT